jgi:putative addiction module killer protein
VGDADDTTPDGVRRLDIDADRNLKITRIEVRQTEAFTRWLHKLRDKTALARIGIRLDRLKRGLLGDVKPVGSGVSEIRIDYGPGYRIYFVRRGNQLILLLCGGDKKSQSNDILRAKQLLIELDN